MTVKDEDDDGGDSVPSGYSSFQYVRRNILVFLPPHRPPCTGEPIRDLHRIEGSGHETTTTANAILTYDPLEN